MMPGMNGYEVTRALRTDPRTEALPIMILTARGQPMDRQMAYDAGANAYLAKPITSKELLSHVNDILTNPPPAQVATSQPIQPQRSTQAAPVHHETARVEPEQEQTLPP